MKNVINATTAGAIARQIIAEANKSANETAVKVTADIKKSANYKKLLRLIKQKKDVESKIQETQCTIADQVTKTHSIVSIQMVVLPFQKSLTISLN
ncbi:hypothetical protein PV783_11480 [Chitinophaga sp. CC14]|uniref:hypothetical protein n=1 Tax=Chitinophaga sp. CC14 TaxID=3029199 RepID=UPI003B7F3962